MHVRSMVVGLVGVFVLGCSSAALARQTPTFTKDVAPILYKNCSQCHRPNEVAPMPLMTYEQVRPWARSIKSKVLKKEMPPWGIGESILKFSNDRQMSEREIFTLVAWVDAGAPKGDDRDLPSPPIYPGGWKFNREPDVVIKMPVEFTIEPRSEYPMLDFYVPVPWTDGMKLIQMSEARPSNKAVVHHITVSLVTFPPGTEVIDGQPYTTDASGTRVPLDRRVARITEQKLPSDLQIPREPGEKPDRLSSVGGFTTLLAYVAGRGFDDHPDGVGTPMLPGQYINFNMHYTPTGRTEVDRSELGLWFAKEPLQKFHFRTPINERQHVNGKLARGPVPDAADVEAGRVSQGATATTVSAFSGLPPIPPYMADYTVTSELAITQDITINGFYPHMHVRGRSARYTVVYPDGKEQLLFDVPHYRFDWQERYVLAESLKIPKGSMLKYKAVFDNSANNPLNPNPDKEVYWSEQSWDEMSLGWIGTPSTGSGSENKVPGVPKVPQGLGWVLVLVGLLSLTDAGAQVPTEQPKGLMPNLGRPTKADDVVPLLDFDKYFLGTWTFEADAPDSVLGPGGESKGTVTYRKLADGFYEAVTEGKGESGPFTIRETIAYHQQQKMAFRHVSDSRGYAYTQMAEVGGNIGGDYRLFFKSAPFVLRGKPIRINHTVYLAAPLTFRIDLEVSEGDGPFVHLSPWRFRRAQR